MGQYFVAVAVEEEGRPGEFLSPHSLGDLAKQVEFLTTGHGLMTGLGLLLSSPTCWGRGGGDWGLVWNDERNDFDRPDVSAVLGRWIGRRVALVGDYDDHDLYGVSTATPDAPRRSLYQHALETYMDIAPLVLAAMCEEPWTRTVLAERMWAVEGGLDGMLAKAGNPPRRRCKLTT